MKVSAPLLPETFGAALLSKKPRPSLAVLRSRSATAALSDGSPPETTLQQRYQFALRFGIPDRFFDHGTRDSLLRQAGLDQASIARDIERWLKEEPRPTPEPLAPVGFNA